MSPRGWRRPLAALACVLPTLAAAQDWRPERTVEYVVPAGPGAALDTAARQLKELVDRQQLLPTTLIVTNKPGGAGMVAMGGLQGRPGDAHMLVTLTHSSINNKLVGEVALGYEDFTPLAVLFDEFITVVVRADSPIKGGRDLVEALKKNPSALSIGVATSIGNHIHAAIAKPLKVAGVDIGKLTVVPFKSSAESMNNLLGGHLDVVSASAVNVVSLMKAGKIRVIAVAAAERLGGDLSGVPTWREQGVDAVYASSQGLLGAKGLSAAQIAYWESLLKRVTDTPEWSAFLAKNHWKPRFMGHAEALRYLDAESAAAKTLLGDLGLLKKK
ncbi:MAG: tripartite tricarboxylate transporter substrate binding protein [Rubrivivax sp.]|nr:tripartite tricarboxylate transporter substrate binding protein [Rubrivivax sp.]